MNDYEQKARELARRIVRQLESRDLPIREADEPAEVRHIRAQVAELNRRLADIKRDDTGDEARLNNSQINLSSRARNRNQSTDFETSNVDARTAQSSSAQPSFEHRPAQTGTGGTFVSAVHPSGQRFGISEAVTELVDYLEHSTATKKICDLEAGDKPCDHCEMCSSRGF